MQRVILALAARHQHPVVELFSSGRVGKVLSAALDRHLVRRLALSYTMPMCPRACMLMDPPCQSLKRTLYIYSLQREREREGGTERKRERERERERDIFIHA